MAKAISLKELYEYLRQFHLSESLYLIGAVNAALKFGLSRDLYTVNIPNYILRWLERLPPGITVKVIIFLSSTRLARFLILSGANDYRSKKLDLSSGTFSKALEMVGELYDEDLENQFKSATSSITNSILGRIGFWQFPLQEDRLTILGRGYHLFVTIPSQLKLTYDFDKKMVEFFEMDCFQFMATGFSLWLMSNGTMDYQLKIEIKALQSIVTDKSQIQFLKVSSGTAKDYRESIRGEEWNKINKRNDFYFLDPFTKIPAIAVDHSLKFRKDSFVIPQAKYLLDRASTGIFYLLADKEQGIGSEAGKDKQNHFRVNFGIVYRKYVSDQLKQAQGLTHLIDLDEDFVNETFTKIPDFALIENNTCILFEVKTTLLNITSRAFLDEEQLANQIKNGSFNKAINQLDDFKNSILDRIIKDSRFQNINKVISIMIGYEDIFVLNSHLLFLLRDHYKSKADNLQLGSISDIDAIGNALNENVLISEILTQKIENMDTEKWGIAQYLQTIIKKDNVILRKSFNEFMIKMGLPQ